MLVLTDLEREILALLDPTHAKAAENVRDELNARRAHDLRKPVKGYDILVALAMLCNLRLASMQYQSGNLGRRASTTLYILTKEGKDFRGTLAPSANPPHNIPA